MSAAERAAVARTFEAIVEALSNDRACSGDRIQLLAGFLRATADSAALAVRRGDRAHVLDKLVADLDRFVAGLAAPEAPEVNPADPFIVDRPIGNSGPQ
jgi:hypothetical protein